jgi:hypothetical protein
MTSPCLALALEIKNLLEYLNQVFFRKIFFQKRRRNVLKKYEKHRFSDLAETVKSDVFQKMYLEQKPKKEH